jgi:hypothetical protein
MAPQADGRTPNRVVRIDDETWTAYGRVCEAKGISRSDDIRMHIKSAIAAHERRQRTAAVESDPRGSLSTAEPD